MLFFPAIDLKNGQCVRLLRGDMDKATVFSDDPAAQARAFVEQGAQYLHVVDLNGAFEGTSINGDAVKRIHDEVGVPIQLGGGIRTMKDVESWLELGIERVILGTAALHNADMVMEACRRFPGQIVVGIDSREDMVSVHGWANVSKITTTQLGKCYEDAGVAAIIYTDVGKDGAMGGPDFKGIEALLDAITTPVIASGGISSLSDIKRLLRLREKGLAGIISGRAIYDGAFTIRDAVELMKA